MKAEKVKKLTQLEQVTETARRHFAHQNSAAVIAKQELLMFEQAQIDRAINNLTAALETHKDRRNIIGATIAGLAEVLACR